MSPAPGLLRPAREEHSEALGALIRVIELGDNQPFLTSEEEVASLLCDPGNPAEDNLRLLWSGEDLIGWGHVAHSPAGKKLERAILHGGIHPEHRRCGFGTQLLAWQVDRAGERLQRTPRSLEAIAIADRYLWQEDKAALLDSAGFADVRWFDELQRDLEDLPPLPELDGIKITPWQAQHHEPARHVYNSAFLDHWGTTPRSSQAWMHDVIDIHGRRLDLSFVASDGDDMVAYCLNGHYPDDEELTGRRDGWIDSICTLASHRGQGIARNLMVHSLHAFAAAGLNSSMLGVDSDNPTGAYGIYERLGYRSLQKSVASVLTIRAGAEPVKMF
jgi:ribosomal protein S18 acetylase RimI-like enzyme